MKKSLKVIALAGALVGVAYIKRDVLFDKCLTYSKKIDSFVDNIKTLESSSRQVKENFLNLSSELNNSSEVLSSLIEDISKYSIQTGEILDKINQKIIK